MKRLYILLFSILLSATACETYTQDDYQEYYVVESYLIADRAIDQLRLSSTAPAFELYTFQNTAVSGAEVQVILYENDQTTIDQVIPFQMESPGIYTPVNQHIVQPARLYRLEISIPHTQAEITAETFVPETFSVISGIQDTVVYQSQEQLELTLSPSSYPGRQNVFIFNTLAEDTSLENLTPVYADLFDEDDDELKDFQNTSSGLINEGNFRVNSDQTVVIRYPWIGVAFYGDNNIIASTVDDAIYNYIRSESVQLGGSTLSPGEIQNVITNIEGGIGVFGSAASDTVETFIKRNPVLDF